MQHCLAFGGHRCDVCCGACSRGWLQVKPRRKPGCHPAAGTTTLLGTTTPMCKQIKAAALLRQHARRLCQHARPHCQQHHAACTRLRHPSAAGCSCAAAMNTG
jgi:hypothetical protein